MQLPIVFAKSAAGVRSNQHPVGLGKTGLACYDAYIQSHETPEEGESGTQVKVWEAMLDRLFHRRRFPVVGRLPDNIVPFRSARYVITVQISKNRHKILQVVFGKKDGSLFVNFPYYQHSRGLVSVATLAGGKGKNQEIALVPGGKVTSHMVKYSHHPDGTALFSQDGLVLSSVRKRSIPLNVQTGHIFTVQFQGLKGFDLADEVKDHDKHDPKRSVLNFSFGDNEPGAIKIVGRWYALRDLLRRRLVHDGPRTFGPLIHCVTNDGKTYVAFLLSPPTQNPMQDFALLMTCEPVPKLNSDEQTCLTFIGGFDPPSVINNLDVDTKMLALSYPAVSYDELKESIGSIDWARS